MLALAAGSFAARDARPFFVGIGGWALVRAAASLSWRDPVVVGGLSVAGLLALSLAAVCLVAVVILARRRPRAVAVPIREGAGDVQWADPETRPRF